MANSCYEMTANELRDRIFQLIPDHPEILSMENPFDLFNVEGFRCDDLDPSHAQATFALAHAKKRWKEANSV